MMLSEKPIKCKFSHRKQTGKPMVVASSGELAYTGCFSSTKLIHFALHLLRYCTPTEKQHKAKYSSSVLYTVFQECHVAGLERLGEDQNGVSGLVIGRVGRLHGPW
jgi:hypothetical protein